MKKKLIRLFYLFSFIALPPITCAAQDGSINFEAGLSWQKIQAKAKAENKLIFLDCYATWCGPCKSMEQLVYPDKAVGKYFNAHFINVKVQMDRTHGDAPEKKAWYATADSLMVLYRIDAYPTFLFFSAEGTPLHRSIGAVGPAQFLDQAIAALNPQRQYFTLLAGWKSHRTDSAYLYNAILATKAAQDEENSRIILNNYVTCVRNPVNKLTIDLLKSSVLSESDIGFGVYLRNAISIDSLYHIDLAEQTLATVIFKDEVAPLFTNRKAAISWVTVSGKLAKKYRSLDQTKFKNELKYLFGHRIGLEIDESLKTDPEAASELPVGLKKRFPGYDFENVLLGCEARYYFMHKEWDKSAKAASALIDKYGDQMDPDILNDYVWRCIFLHCSDETILARALKNVGNGVKRAPGNVDLADTYANLLYKTGKKQEGIQLEQDLAQQRPNDRDIANTLQKMKNGEQTWGDKTSD